MSETAQKLFDGLRAIKESAQAIAPGLKNIGPDFAAEMARLGKQGAAESASALFNGHGFVPYGPGQYTPSRDEQSQEQEQGKERQMER